LAGKFNTPYICKKKIGIRKKFTMSPEEGKDKKSD
jgi:hypothetical protein